MIIRNLDNPGKILDLTETKRLKAGLVILKPNHEIGAHVTDQREEAIIVLDGEALIMVEGKEFRVRKNQLAYIPPEKNHNVINQSDEVLRYLYLVAMDIKNE